MSIQMQQQIKDLTAMVAALRLRVIDLESRAAAPDMGESTDDHADTRKTISERISALEQTAQTAAMADDQITALQAEVSSLRKRITEFEAAKHGNQAAPRRR